MFQQPFLNSIMMVVIAATVGLATTALWRRMDRKVREAEAAKTEISKKAERLAEEHKTLVNTVEEMKRKLGAFEQIAEPLNALMQKALIKELTHFHTPEMDALLVKVGGLTEGNKMVLNTLTDEDERRLAELLVARSEDLNGRISDSERDAAIMLPMVIKRAKREAEAALTIEPELKLVAVTDPPKEVKGEDTEAKKD